MKVIRKITATKFWNMDLGVKSPPPPRRKDEAVFDFVHRLKHRGEGEYLGLKKIEGIFSPLPVYRYKNKLFHVDCGSNNQFTWSAEDWARILILSEN